MSDLKINENAVAFISEWKNRNSEQQRKYIATFVAAFVVVFLICIMLFFWFQNANYERIVNQNMKYIQDSAIQEANQVEQKMENSEEMIISIAGQYARLTEFKTDATIEEKLTLLQGDALFDRVSFIAPDGTSTSLKSTTNVADRQYFKNAIRGMKGWESLEKSRVTGEPSVVFYSPVIVDDHIIGVMAGFYEREKLDDLFSYELFNYNPTTYLLMGDGTIVASSNDEKIGENFLKDLSDETYEGDVDYDKISDTINDASRTTVTFSFVDSRKTYVGVIIQFKSTDWMVASVLPHTVTGDMVSGANSIGQVLLISISAVFLVLVILVIWSMTIRKKRLEREMEKAIENLEATIDDEVKQLFIIRSLVDAYSSVYYIDIEANTYSRVKELEKASLAIPDEGEAAVGIAAYVNGFVEETYKEDMHNFLNVGSFAKRFSDGESQSLEYQRSDNGWRRVWLIPSGYDENGNLISVVFAVQKIDREKEKENKAKKALQEAYETAQFANSAKTSFLSNMSHDIRTPMNAIIGMTAIAASNVDNPEKVADCLKKITSSSKHLLGLINEVLDMSKIESGRVDLIEEEFSLSEVIDDLITIHQPLIKEKGHSLSVKVNHVKHEKVIGDSVRLQQVFTNLLSNAIKYTPDKGKIEIIVTEKETNKSSIGMYEVVFRDNGIGISEEFQEKLFAPFSRAKDQRITHIQGTGLGMPIAKNIINMMNGDITVQSKLNEGSTFTVSFVLRLQQEKEVNYEKFIDLPVLVVDDDIIACECACTILDKLEMKSEWVTSGKEAVKRTVEHHERDDDYYAVIVDWKMPEMDGIETTRQIRQKVGNDVPIIVISSYDWREIEDEAREAGANAFLSKPIFESKVTRLFNELIDDTEEKVQETSQTDSHDFSGRRILLVEDNELNREITAELLSMANLELEFAEDGKIGFEKFSISPQGYYDMILMDIQMPVMDGYESTKAIRASSHPDAKTVPIIAMSANAFATDVRASIGAGMNDHIAKPIDMERVMKVLSDYIGD